MLFVVRARLGYTFPPVRLPSPLLHGLVAIVAIILITVVTYRGGDTGANLTAGRAEIGIEHTTRLTLSLVLSERGGNGIADISHTSGREIYVSLPMDWTRREVRGAPLATTAGDAPTFGFRRWRIPAGALISFAIPHFPSSMLLHNPSGIPMEIDLTRVDLDTTRTERNVILVQEGTVELW